MAAHMHGSMQIRPAHVSQLGMGSGGAIMDGQGMGGMPLGTVNMPVQPGFGGPHHLGGLEAHGHGHGHGQGQGLGGLGGLGGMNRGSVNLSMRKPRGRDGKEVRARPYNKARCPHNRDHYSCRECGGAGICMHKRRKSQCRDCGGKSVCQHNRVRSYCKECGGGGLCQHNRVRSKCKDCGGSGICKHGRHKNLCRDCGGSGICIHKHQKNKVKISLHCLSNACVKHCKSVQNCRKCQKLNTCGHKIARKTCSECRALRDAGPEALAVRVHELLGILEEEEVLEADHPAYAQIRDKVEGLRLMALAHASAPLTSGSAQDKPRLQQHKKRKRDELFPSYNLGPYPPDMQGSEQYQQMAVNYYHQMQLMQQQQLQQQHIPPHMARKKMRKGAMGSVNDRVDAINKLYLQGLKEIKTLLEEKVLSPEEFETEKQRLYKKKEASLAKQREDEQAAIMAGESPDGMLSDVRGMMNDHYQQALAMYYYQQQAQQQGRKKSDKQTMSEEEDEGEELEADEAGTSMPREQGQPQDGIDKDDAAGGCNGGVPAGAADLGTVTDGEDVGSSAGAPGPMVAGNGMPPSLGKFGKSSGKRGLAVPAPFPMMPMGWGGFGNGPLPPFPTFPFPMLPPTRALGRKTSNGVGADGGMDGPKKRGRPRKNLLAEHVGDMQRDGVAAPSVPPEPPATPVAHMQGVKSVSEGTATGAPATGEISSVAVSGLGI